MASGSSDLQRKKSYGGAVSTFATIRSQTRLKVADAIHLALAAGIDLFLTRDKQLQGLHVPGIRFIADFNSFLL